MSTPTCDTFGEETAECIVCGQKRTRTIAPLGYRYQWCGLVMTGIQNSKCDVCDKIVERAV